PSLLPCPPSTTAHRNSIELMMLNVGGATYWTCPAYNAPDSPPIAAPITNAQTLNLKVLTPITSAASSSSRMAIQARPTRLRSRLPTSTRITAISTRPNQNHQVP